MGGAGLDALAYALVMEELSRGYASVADQCGLVELIGTLLVRARHARAAARASCGRCSAPRSARAYCITEAEAGTDVSGIRTTAERDGRRLAAVRLASSGSTMRRSPISASCWRAPTRRPASAA